MNYIFHKVKSIGIVNDTTLIAQFEDGVCKTYDMTQLLGKFPVFKDLLEDKQLFKLVRVEGSGFGIVWNDYFDLSCNELWDNGKTVQTPFDDLLALSDATELRNHKESTLRKAISYGKLKVGYDVCNYGKQWVVTREAMMREYGIPESWNADNYWKEAMVAESSPEYGRK